MELVYKVLVKENQPNSSGWFDTNVGNIYWDGLKEVWSCRDDRVSEEYPKWWLYNKNFSNSPVYIVTDEQVLALTEKLGVKIHTMLMIEGKSTKSLDIINSIKDTIKTYLTKHCLYFLVK